MYCQISLIKPKARQKEAMASLFGNHKQITLRNSDTTGASAASSTGNTAAGCSNAAVKAGKICRTSAAC